MNNKPGGYGENFTVKCGHCNGIQVNSIHAHLGNHFQNQNMTVLVAMEMKYLRVGNFQIRLTIPLV